MIINKIWAEYRLQTLILPYLSVSHTLKCVFTFGLTDLVRKAIYNVDAAMKSFGRQKRDVMKTKMVDQLKKKANELLGKMENKQSK